MEMARRGDLGLDRKPQMQGIWVGSTKDLVGQMYPESLATPRM